MNSISHAVEKVGGPIAAAKACGITRQAIDKWIAKGRLPRSDYTGETQYAAKLAAASDGAFTEQWLLDAASPNRVA